MTRYISCGPPVRFLSEEAIARPGFARQQEREQYKNDLAVLGISTRMCVFIDEKMFQAEEATKRWASYGYSVVGTRLPRRYVLTKFSWVTNAAQPSASNARFTISKMRSYWSFQSAG